MSSDHPLPGTCAHPCWAGTRPYLSGSVLVSVCSSRGPPARLSPSRSWQHTQGPGGHPCPPTFSLSLSALQSFPPHCFSSAWNVLPPKGCLDRITSSLFIHRCFMLQGALPFTGYVCVFHPCPWWSRATDQAEVLSVFFGRWLGKRSENAVCRV